jgi:CRISPR system Cascade subunit CasD
MATDFLLFTLAAPMASFGAIAVGERRPSWGRPSKSQVLGLIASSLGIERGEEERLAALASALHYAVRVDAPGRPHSDYHTAQVPSARRNRRFATRAEELAVSKTELRTILSRRDFYTDAMHTVAVWARSSAVLPAPLVEIASALAQPCFTPFVGRKAYPLLLPMAPQIITTETIVAAFAAFDSTEPEARKAFRLRVLAAKYPQAPPSIFVDADAVPEAQIERLEQRRDIPQSRAKWRFTTRAEALLKPAEPTAGDAA